ncbi:PucC family protein [Leptolyngbya sp. 15MV]|nr:PucC family protein [Leptolyngbya sp. 15MV]
MCCAWRRYRPRISSMPSRRAAASPKRGWMPWPTRSSPCCATRRWPKAWTALRACMSCSKAAIGFGVGLFSVGTLVAAMALAREGTSGLALGAWGAVQASCAGLAIAAGGMLRDLVSGLAVADGLGPTLADRATGYSVVYLAEIALLLATLVVLGPLVGRPRTNDEFAHRRFGLDEFPT